VQAVHHAIGRAPENESPRKVLAVGRHDNEIDIEVRRGTDDRSGGITLDGEPLLSLVSDRLDAVPSRDLPDPPSRPAPAATTGVTISQVTCPTGIAL